MVKNLNFFFFLDTIKITLIRYNFFLTVIPKLCLAKKSVAKLVKISFSKLSKFPLKIVKISVTRHGGKKSIFSSQNSGTFEPVIRCG